MSAIRRLFAFLSFTLFLAKELLLANLHVARAILAPNARLKPLIVAVPLSLTRDLDITFLANLITLTPGTLSLDVSEDRKVLWVHALHAEEPDALRREIKDGFERRIQEMFP